MRVHYRDVVSNDDGWSLLLLDAILLVPVAMLIMFWPLQAGLGSAAVGAAAFGLYKLSQRRHTH